MQNNRVQLPQKSHTYVSADGTGDYKTIQEAVDAVPLQNTGNVIIHIRPGIYEEPITVSGDKPHISFIGEDAANTVITYGNYAGKLQENGDVTGTFRSATVSIYASHFIAKNISFVNSYDGKGTGGGQAVALYALGEYIIFENCRFCGRQDTLYTREGTQYYKNCYIEGTVDFIFGGARAVFEECEIRSLLRKQGDKERTGYITAPSTPISQKYGYLFLNCITRGDEKNTVYLGRPWHPGADPNAIGSCVFMQCELGEHIREDGWTNMGGFLAANARFYEWNNHGPGAIKHENRRVLTDEEALEYTKERILGWEEE